MIALPALITMFPGLFRAHCVAFWSWSLCDEGFWKLNYTEA